MQAAVHIAEPASDAQLTLLGYGNFVKNETARYLSNSNAQSTAITLNTGGLSFHLNYRSAR